MKRFICLILVLMIGFALSACSKTETDIDTTITKTNSETEQPIKDTITEQQITLKEYISESEEINYDSHHVEISIYTDEHYYFTNRNQEFYSDLIGFLEKSITVTETEYQYDPEVFEYTIAIYDNTNSTSISILKTDIIYSIYNDTAYYCEGIYETVKSLFKPHIDIYNDFCRSASTKVRYRNEYVIQDKNRNILDADCISREPSIFYIDGIVHLWVQTGTGHLTRWTYFYDVETGEKSPVYSGQTDFYKNVVISVRHSGVYFYDMFTGEELYVINEFEKPLLDGMENVESAYFTEDGTQVIVEYLNTDCHTETQIFDFPQEFYAD